MDRLRDEATGVFSWEAFLAFSAMLVEQVKRRRGALSLVLVALDEPRGVPGDTAVRIMAQRTVRATDTVARHGPYSLAVLAPDAPQAGALRLAERFSASLPSQLETASGPVAARFSIGIAVLPPEGWGLAELVEAAEVALAQAVAAGGAQIRVSSRASDNAFEPP